MYRTYPIFMYRKHVLTHSFLIKLSTSYQEVIHNTHNSIHMSIWISPIFYFEFRALYMWYNILRQTTSSYIKNRIRKGAAGCTNTYSTRKSRRRWTISFSKPGFTRKAHKFQKRRIIKQEDFESIYILLEGELNQIMHSKGRRRDNILPRGKRKHLRRDGLL